MKIAFIDSVFPGLTTTFVNREYEYLKSRDEISISAYSIKRPSPDLLNKEYRDYIEDTTYLRPDNTINIIIINLLTFVTLPSVYFRNLKIVSEKITDHSIKIIARILVHFFYGVFLGRNLKVRHYDLIHAHFSSASTIALVAHLFSKVPFSFTLHASDDLYSEPILLEAKCKYSRFVVTNSSYNERHINLLTRYQFDEKLHVIYNGVDISCFSDITQKEHRSSPMRILSVGSFSGCKGYPTVLEALGKLKQENIDFIYTIIAGGSLNEQDMIERLISRYDLVDNVILLGRQPFTRVKEEMCKTDLVIMASEISIKGIRDGLPNAVIEAMLFNRPVISTYISDIPNIIKSDETGYLFPEKNSAALSRLIKHVYFKYEDTHYIVQEARKFAVSAFDASKNYDVLVNLLLKKAQSDC